MLENFAGINFRGEEVDEYFVGINFRDTRILHYNVNKLTFFRHQSIIVTKKNRLILSHVILPLYIKGSQHKLTANLDEIMKIMGNYYYGR